MTSLTVEDLWAGYSGRPVLRGVDFAVKSNSVTAIIGPNGHGKTTLLRCFSGLLRPTSGRIVLDNQPIEDLPPHKVVELGVTHVPQGDLVFPGMSVADNLLMGAYLVGDATEVRRRLDETYAFLPRLAERSRQVASTLSGGERRMLGIGRGLMAKGKIMLIDEPSLGLAPIVIDQIYGILNSLKESGKTIILVEENASRVVDMAERVLLLDNGRVVWQGSGPEMADSRELLSAYLGD